MFNDSRPRDSDPLKVSACWFTRRSGRAPPVVAGNTGGMPLQIQDGAGGFLVNSVAECAERALLLPGHPQEAEQVARSGWERVKNRFLMPRLLLDEFRLLASLVRDKGWRLGSQG